MDAYFLVVTEGKLDASGAVGGVKGGRLRCDDEG